jgi:ribosomal protein S18 acetylase RimI-like enzyme
VLRRSPTGEEFRSLIEAVGWGPYTNLEALPAAIGGSLFCVTAVSRRGRVDSGRVIGAGRVVGDGARFFYLQDIMVLPEWQGRGVGTAITDALVEYINRHAPREAYVHLFTSREMAGFYRRYGFQGPEQPFYGMSLKKFDKPIGRVRRGGSRHTAPALPATQFASEI